MSSQYFERQMLMENDRETETLLASDHAELDHAFDALVRAIDNNDAAESFSRLDLLWARLGMHIRAEHLWLFPAILNAIADEREKPAGVPDPAIIRFSIEGLRNDHEFFMHAMARAVNILRNTLTPNSEDSNSWNGLVRDIIIAVRQRLETHNIVEEEKVYRWASVLLTDTDQGGLALHVRNELENLPPRFKENSNRDALRPILH